MAEVIVRVFRFGVVGVIGIFIDFSITWLLKEKLRINKFLANATGFSIAVFSNYMLNRVWTFENSNPDISTQFLVFGIVSLVGLVLNTSIIYILNKKKGLNFYLGKILAIAIVFIWNFFANSFITFHYA